MPPLPVAICAVKNCRSDEAKPDRHFSPLPCALWLIAMADFRSAMAFSSGSRGGPPMYAVIFEVQPKPGRAQDYLDIAASLRADLEKFDGFLSIERFQSLSTDGKILSLSFWRDAEAVTRWREQERHRRAQAHGRYELFADYRLSVVEVVRQYGPVDRAEAPQP
jgi:heme-degrading monooxygenase HmoA